MIPTKPPLKWRVAEWTFWLSTPVILFVLKGFGVIAIPFLFMFAFGLAGPLRELAGEDPRCPQCNRFMPKPTKR
ncbi:MAG: hypothetical protein Q8Q09_18470 [Deltaproteobacteria bacterium]|nr:hypothetical protein [Deltaproteobacteria bacterium]